MLSKSVGGKEKKYVAVVILMLFPFFNIFEAQAPIIEGSYVFPQKAFPGDEIELIVAFEDNYGLANANAHFFNEKDAQIKQMILIAGDKRKGTYQATWIVEETKEEQWYDIKVVLENKKGKISEKILKWQDPQPSHKFSAIKNVAITEPDVVPSSIKRVDVDTTIQGRLQNDCGAGTGGYNHDGTGSRCESDETTSTTMSCVIQRGQALAAVTAPPCSGAQTRFGGGCNADPNAPGTSGKVVVSRPSGTTWYCEGSDAGRNVRADVMCCTTTE